MVTATFYEDVMSSINSYYPPLSALADISIIPPQLDFIGHALNSLLDRIYFRDLQHSTSRGGGREFYSLTLLTYRKIGIEIPGTGIGLYLNPPDPPGSAGGTLFGTGIPLTLEYEWGIADLVRGFDLETFKPDPKTLFGLIARTMKLDTSTLAGQAIAAFAGGSLESFIGDINTWLGNENIEQILSPDAGLSDPEKIANVIGQIEDNAGVPLPEALWNVYLSSTGDAGNSAPVDQLFRPLLGGKSMLEYIGDLLAPKINASLRLKTRLEFPRTILKPLIIEQGQPHRVDENPEARSTLDFAEGTLCFNTSKGIGFDAMLDATLVPSQIGDTGLTLSFTQARLDLSTTASIPESVADGRGEDFVGVYIRDAEIGLPAFWRTKPDDERPQDLNHRARIIGRNILIGTGGLSGSFSLLTTDDEPLLETRFGATEGEPGSSGFGIALDRFDISFHQGAIVGSDIHGTLRLPVGDGDIALGVTIAVHNGGFTIAVQPDPPVSFGMDNVFSLTITKIGVGSLGSRYYLEAAGSLEILADLPGVGRIFKQPIEIGTVIIWSNGEIDFQGGSFVLNEAVRLVAGPVDFSVTAIHIGSEEGYHAGHRRHYRYFGFDGGVKTGIGGVDARGDGIKLYYTSDNTRTGLPGHIYLRLESIKVSLTIPGDATEENVALILKGWLSMKNRASGESGGAIPEYAGGVTFSLPKLGTGGGANLKMIPSIGAFLVDANLEFPSPILLGSTGLGIYGLNGIFGNKYILRKGENERWWEFYRKPDPGVNVQKFSRADGFAIGAGVSMATAGDSGEAFSSKLMFILSIPGMLAFEGRASILSTRLGLSGDEDPPFFAVLSLSEIGVEAAFGINYQRPRNSGDIFSLNAIMELGFFYGRSSAWHVNIGRDAPDTMRIGASMLKVLHGKGYLMLGSGGIKVGQSVEFKFEQDCAVARVGLYAALEVGGRASFRPLQIGGWGHVGGYAELKIFGFGFRLNVDAFLMVEAPRPFAIAGSLSLGVSPPWPFPDVNLSVGIGWTFNNERNIDEIGFIGEQEYSGSDAIEAYVQQRVHPVKAIHMISGEPFLLNYVNHHYPERTRLPSLLEEAPEIPPPDSGWIGSFDRFTLPLDSFIDIEFSKGVDPASIRRLGPIQTGRICEELVPPQKGREQQVRHRYVVDSVSLHYWSASAHSWQDYTMAQANTPLIDLLVEQGAGRSEAIALLESHLYDGFWQLSNANSYTRLRILARSPLQQNPSVELTELGFPERVLVCPPPERPLQCLDWNDVPVDTVYDAAEKISDRRLQYRISGSAATVKAARNPFGMPHSLVLPGGEQIEILFPQPVTKVSMKLTALSEQVAISYYLGYRYNPEPVRRAPNGSRIERWEISTAGGGMNDTADDLWDKLRAIPSFIRAFCSGPLRPDSVAVAALGSIMDQKFRTTNAYLRRRMGLEPAQSAAGFCERLKEMLETVIVSISGNTPAPRYLQPNLEYFYRDARHYAGKYIQAFIDAGEMVPEPPAEHNELYEKWMDLLACAGKLSQHRDMLPKHARPFIPGMIDPAVASLYIAARSSAGQWGVELNQPTDITDPVHRARYVAEFFARESLDVAVSSRLATLSLSFERLFDALESALKKVRAMLKFSREDICGGAAGSIVAYGVPEASYSGCGGASGFADIITTICMAGAPAESPALDRISALIDEGVSTVVAIENYFGWPDSTTGTDLCSKLRRTLRAISVACSGLGALPASLRSRVRKLYGTLLVHLGEYRKDTRGFDPAGPDEAIITCIGRWYGALACLCSLCNDFDALHAQDERPYFISTVDPELDSLYNAIAGELASGDTIITGSGVSNDLCEQLSVIAVFLNALAMRCEDPMLTTSDMLGWLSGEAKTDFASAHAALTGPGGALEEFSTIFCEGTGNGNSMSWLPMLGTLECLYRLISRSAYLPQDILGRINADFSNNSSNDLSDPLYTIMKKVYQPGVGDPADPLVPSALPPAEQNLYKLDYILPRLYLKSLQGEAVNDPNHPEYQEIEAIVAALADEMADLNDALLALPEGTRIDICQVGRGEGPERERSLLDIYRRLCDDLSLPLQGAHAGVATVIRNAGPVLDELALVLGSDPIRDAWPDSAFCSVVREVVLTLVTAYSFAEHLSPALQTKLYDLSRDLLAADTSVSSPMLNPGCEQISGEWLSMLHCLRVACVYLPHLPAGIREGLEDDTLQDAMGTQIRRLYRKVLLWGDQFAMATGPGRSTTDRCRKVQLITNYLTGAIIDFDPRNADNRIGLFDAHQTLVTALEDAVLVDALNRLCPIPGDGPYDPLKKRERKSRVELLREVRYGFSGEPSPIDRIVIAPAVGCDPNDPIDWSAVVAEIHQILGDAAASQEEKDALAAFVPDMQELSSEPCKTLIHQICWQTQADHDYNNDLPDEEIVRETTNDIIIGLRDLNQPIWRPNTIYAIQIATSEYVDNHAIPYRRFLTYGFKTAGPIGHFHETGNEVPPLYNQSYQELLQAEREDEFKYADLKLYLDYPRCYPNADGNIIGAKPLYYASATLSLFYLKDYVAAMYGRWDTYGDLPEVRSGLQVVVYDQGMQKDKITGEAGKITVDPVWKPDLNPPVEKEFEVFRYIMNADPQSNCLEFELFAEDALPKAKQTTVPVGVALEPQRLYTAMFNAVLEEGVGRTYSRPVHKYVFQTSRYPNFEQHIRSCILSVEGEAERTAIVRIKVPSQKSVLLSQVLLDDSSVEVRELNREYGDPLERVIEGALGLKNLPPALTNEFIIINEEGGGIIGVLVRSPEPLNDPKLPIEQLGLGLQTEGFGSAPVLVFSKDVTRAFVTGFMSGADVGVAPGILTFVFTYRLFNGTEFAQVEAPQNGPATSVTITFDTQSIP